MAAEIAEQAQSGQSVRLFCRERGLGEHSFYSWRQLLRKESPPVRFTLVETKPASEAAAQPMELVLAPGDRLRIPADAATLRIVLGVLRER
jgi:transposase-like protein